MATDRNMYSVALKPRLLRAVLRDQLPAEKGQFPDLLELRRAVSVIKTYSLLSESYGGADSKKISGNWKTAIDDFFSRSSLLVSSNMPDKCWAGVSLLGLTCQECSSERFLASYSAWFEKLILFFIQSPADSVFVKVASCASLSDLLKRLDQFPNLQKDKSILAGKLIQPTLKLLKEDHSEAVQEGSLDLLSTLIRLCPFAVQRHYDQVESAICEKIALERNSISMNEKLASCLATLPGTRGDGQYWASLMQRILLFINADLNDAFQGLEEETKGSEAVRLLIKPGEDPPSALFKNKKNSSQTLTHVTPTLMLCCYQMLTNSYSFQVAVPIKSLLALVVRILSVDGSISQDLDAPVTSVQQEFICSELPVLHYHGLELVIALTKGIRTEMLPHGARIVRILTWYLKKCVLSELRIKVYNVIRILLMSKGAGVGKSLAEEITDNVVLDLKLDQESRKTSSNLQSDATEGLSRKAKKRKHASAAASIDALHEQSDLASQEQHPKVAPPVKIAALETLEVLINVAGAFKKETWRSKVDSLLISVATEYSNMRWAHEQTETLEELRIAALRALMASLISPSPDLPARLAKSLGLFRRDRLETGTKIGDFCVHSLFVLEGLAHPRTHPLSDYVPLVAQSSEGSSRRDFETTSFRGLGNGSTMLSGLQGAPARSNILSLLDYDDHHETNNPILDQAQDADQTYEPPSSIAEGSTEKIMNQSHDVAMVDLQPLEEMTKKPEEPGPSKAASIPLGGGGPQEEPKDDRMDGSDENVSVDKGNVDASDAAAATSGAGKGKEIEGDTDDDSPGDITFPDIIDVEPDTDED